MAETTGNKNTGKGGNTNTTTSDNKSGSGRSGSETTGKQNEKTVQSTVVDQGSPAEVVVEIKTEEKSDQKSVPKRKKPAQKKKPTKEKAEAEKVKDIQNLLEGVFLVASLKAGEHWQLSQDESKQIAHPLSRILDRYDLLTKATEVSDPVALIVACATIVFPRVMVTKMTADQKKADTLRKNGVMNDVKKGSDPVNGGSNGGSNNTTNQSNDGQFIKAIHNEVQTGL